MAEVIHENGATGPVVTEHAGEMPGSSDEMRVIGHSPIFYWWPVWFFGFIMAAVTWFGGETVVFGNGQGMRVHPNSVVGLSYTLILVLVFLITNMSLRGLVSGMVIMGGLFIIILFAWLGWWEYILFLIPDVHVYMNLGFYLTVSVLTLIAWTASFFVFDRLDYWRIMPGQVTLEHLVGGAEKSYDTGGLVFEQLHVDFFKHWLLGLGAGDLKMSVPGANRREYYIPNVLFVNYKVKKIQQLIKRKPD